MEEVRYGKVDVSASFGATACWGQIVLLEI